MHWLPRFQWPGIGFALVSALAPTLGIPIPLFVRWMAFFLGVLMCCAPLIEAGYVRANKTGTMVPFIGALISGFCFVGFSIWFFWPTGSSLDRKLIVNCESPVPRPWKGREDKKIYIVQIGDAKTPAFNSALGPGEGELKLKGIFPLWMGKCEIINFSGANLFRVSSAMDIRWQSVVKTNGNTTNGEVIASAPSVSPEFDLSADGKNNSDFFYVVNMSEYYVYIPTPTHATIHTSDSDAAKTVTLIPSTSPMPGVLLEPKALGD